MAESVRDDLVSTLLPCSYGGVPFLYDTASTIGGRRATARAILHSDEQIVSDVGLKQRTRNVRGYIAAQEQPNSTDGTAVVTRTYAEHRATLLAAFEDPTPKTFVHPIEGAITGLVAVNFSVDEGQNEWGLGRVSVEFIRDTQQPTPVPDFGSGPAVLAAADEANASLFDSLAKRWKMDPAVVGVFEDGLAKAKAAFSALQDIANEGEVLLDAVDSVAAATSEGIASAARLIALPQQLANEVGNALAVLASAFPTALAAFEGMVQGFGFGDVDFSIDLRAPSARLRKENADAMNAAMNGALLAEAYRFGTGIDFVTLDEIDRVESTLDAQHGALIDSGSATSESLDALENLRTAFASYLDRARLAARKLVAEDTAPTTPRVLAYALYESDELTQTLAGLNDVLPYQLVAGRVTVLSS